ncbi:DUF1801 domain-containing protein [Rhizobium sp. S163]|uniref:DUF1801 domain-containing protein n=1 Tax=Rhizobium sp. S163 TaxID=3055039 RepID=UPI0025A93BE5|nr:DUF1801 domain-containing protein [Rhizobium sp. S163]MDM9648879.1 DUF1801 domain-containing protein [Rhizobium sp. S163]
MSAPKLLSGGNPQIPKGEGDAPVQAYIAAMPGWKSAVGKALDELITGLIPDLHKAVKWNTPLYGAAAGGWFLAFHCFDRYIKVTFFKGASLNPLPPVGSKQEGVRYVHLHEDERFDAALLKGWILQAAALPGEVM